MVESAAAAAPRAERPLAGRVRPSVLPILALVALLVLVERLADPIAFYDPPWLILIGNLVFVAGVGLGIASVAARNYRATGRIQLLLLGCAALVFGLGAAVAASVRSLPDGANLNVSIYNTAALLAAAAHAKAAFFLLVRVSPEVGAGRRRLWLVVGYGGSVLLMALLTVVCLEGLLPPFFVQGLGPTLMRQHVLGAAEVLFLFSLVVFFGTHLRTRDEFLYWYAGALALVAISLAAFLAERSVGSPLGWVGRSAQYLGGVYFLVALVKAARTAQSRGTSLDNVLTSSLSGADEKFRALAENVPDVICRFDRELRHIYVNVAGQRLYGRPAGAIVGKRMDEVAVADRHGDLWNERLRHVFETGERAEIEEYLQTRGGTVFYQSQCVPEYDNDGAVANVLVVSRDLTERERAEEALRGSEAQYRSLFNTMTEGFAAFEVIFDASGRPIDYVLLVINPAFERLTGRSRDQVVGKAVMHVFPGEDPRWLDELAAVAVTGEPAHFEKWVPTLGRQYEGYAFRSAPRQIAVLFRDVTARRAAEQALELAKAAAEEANAQKDHFLAVLSHELRNPLTPIRNSAYILQRAVPGSDQARRAQAVIDRQARQLSRLVDDLLDVTRISRNKVRLRRERLELNELVRRAVEDQRSLFDDAGVRLEVRGAPDAVLVDGDASRLAQIVDNLLQNAAKFTPRGGQTWIAVGTDEALGRAIIRVCDSGVGMEPELVARLFQPFMQADVTLARSKGGLGLGLALVKGLVELHGGDVSARSEGLGMGAEIVVRLPLAPRESTAPRAGRDTAAGSRRLVLVIDDNVDAAETLRDALQLVGHEVVVACNGPEGIAKALQRVPDVVLCDLGLPGMDGYEVARAMRAEPALAGTFLVALSGYTMPSDLQSAAEAGFARHLAKPVTLETLEALLAGLDGGERAAAPGV